MDMTITIEGLPSGTVRLDHIEGLILLTRAEHGVGRCVLGQLNALKVALMLKALFSGDDKEGKMTRLAKGLAEVLPDFAPEQTIDLSPVKEDGLNDPFAELMEEDE